MKVSRRIQGEYHVVSFYVPQPEGHPRKISRKFPVKEKGSERRAERLRKQWEKQIAEVGRAGILPPVVLQDVRAAKGELVDFPGVSLLDAAKFYKAHNVARATPSTVGEAVDGYIRMEKNRGVSGKTLEQYIGRTGEFKKKFGSLPVHQVRGADVVDWVVNLGASPVTLWGYLGCVERVFGYCVAERIIKDSPVGPADLKRMPPKKNQTAPVILSGEEGKSLFEAFPLEEKAMFAVMYFTGIRRTVGQKITWGDVDRESKVIHVPALADKKGRERFIEGMPDRLWEILDHFPEFPKSRPLVVSDRRFKTLMGKAIKGAGIKEWPKNALRRSFASHHLNFKNPDANKDRLTETLLIMCHQGKPDVFWNFYFRRSKPGEAATYFDVDLSEAEKKELGGH